MVFLDVATMAMQELGVLAQGEVPTAAEANDAFNRANNMLDSWSADALMIYYIPRTVYSLTPGIQQYTMGPGSPPVGAASLSLVRPPKITRVGIISLASSTQPLELVVEMLTDQQWQLIPIKNIQSSLPLRVWDDRGFPQRSLWFWMIPNVAVNVAIYAWQALAAFPDLNTTTITFPPGYMEAVVYNLALRMAPSYLPPNVPPNPITVQMAKDALTRVEAQNTREYRLYCDAALLAAQNGVFNWITGDGTVPGGPYTGN